MNIDIPPKTDTISSNTLFHFTNSASSLISILLDEFRPHYCLEDFKFSVEGDEPFELAIPMVCFCDLPLSQIKTHLRLYGNYGIGMNKLWGQKNGISPVLYSYRGSYFFRHIRDILTETSQSLANPNNQSLKYEKRFIGILSFIKPYLGPFWRKDNYIPSVRFYDEREWRYVPETLPNKAAGFSDPDLFSIADILQKEDFLNPVKLADNNRKIARDKFRIPFSPNDIKYLIVSEENEILPLIKSIREIKGKYSHDEVDLLTSRIISSSQIIDDF
ncbi:MAG: abortive infection system antitoxin AbiGi family protein [Ignavibacteriaceae bacterium]|jgi:hypothetical protein